MIRQPAHRKSFKEIAVILATFSLLAGCTSKSELEVGDCIADPGQTTTTRQVTSVSCHANHFGEIIGTYTATDGSYPDVQVLANESETTCSQAFETVVGIPPAQSVYDLFPLVPSESSWENGDRTVLCVVSGSDGESLTEPVAQTRR